MFASTEREPDKSQKCQGSGTKELEKMPSRVVVGPPLNSKPPNLTTQNKKDIEAESESEDEKEEGKGLGLVFYDHKGSKSRSKVYKLDDQIVTEAKSLVVANSPRDCATSSRSSLNSRRSTPRPYDPDFGLPPDTLIERLLEENYRGQAETFARISSLSSIRSRSISSRSVGTRSTSCSSGGSSAVTRSATFETPSRPPPSFAAVRRSQSLRSPSNPSHTLSRSFSGTNRIVFEPYRDEPSPTLHKHSTTFSSAKPPPASPSTYGHRVFSVPENASPGQIKSRSRSISVAARGPLYFTKEERQAIAELVLAGQPTRHCRHPNCTDCTDIEYAYHENKAMATSLPPEDRQKIINNNRSLRNIKNVSITS
jgi:hypothetical protein